MVIAMNKYRAGRRAVLSKRAVSSNQKSCVHPWLVCMAHDTGLFRLARAFSLLWRQKTTNHSAGSSNCAWIWQHEFRALDFNFIGWDTGGGWLNFNRISCCWLLTSEEERRRRRRLMSTRMQGGCRTYLVGETVPPPLENQSFCSTVQPLTEHCMHRDLYSRRYCISVSIARDLQLDLLASARNEHLDRVGAMPSIFVRVCTTWA
jgi:hypothetical protein